MLLMKNLAQKSLSIDELITIIENDEIDPKFISREAVIKYLNTLKSAGVNICKIKKNRTYYYYVDKQPQLLNMDKNDISSLAFTENYINSLYQNKIINDFAKFMNITSKFLTDDDLKLLNKERKKLKQTQTKLNNNYNKYRDILPKAEQSCSDGQRVFIKYRLPSDEMTKNITLEPKLLKYDSKNICLIGYNPIAGEKQAFLLDYIEEIRQLPQKSKYDNIMTPVMFKLKGRLAKGYNLYDNEKFVENSEYQDEDSIIVANYEDDKEYLLKRLLRYGEYCEAVYPKSFRNKFIQTVKETLLNYEKSSH